MSLVTLNAARAMRAFSRQRTRHHGEGDENEHELSSHVHISRLPSGRYDAPGEEDAEAEHSDGGSLRGGSGYPGGCGRGGGSGHMFFGAAPHRSASQVALAAATGWDASGSGDERTPTAAAATHANPFSSDAQPEPALLDPRARTRTLPQQPHGRSRLSASAAAAGARASAAHARAAGAHVTDGVAAPAGSSEPFDPEAYASAVASADAAHAPRMLAPLRAAARRLATRMRSAMSWVRPTRARTRTRTRMHAHARVHSTTHTLSVMI
jgi:hypothetical protein